MKYMKLFLKNLATAACFIAMTLVILTLSLIPTVAAVIYGSPVIIIFGLLLSTIIVLALAGFVSELFGW